MGVTGGLGAPLFYGVIVGYVGLLASAIYNAIFQAVMGPRLFQLPRQGELERLLPYVQGGLGLVFQVVLGPLLITIGLFLFTAIVHVLLTPTSPTRPRSTPISPRRRATVSPAS